MKEILEVFSDLHNRYLDENILHTSDGRDVEPFFESAVRFVIWYENRPAIAPDERITTMFLGDIFHRPRENGFVNGLVSRLMFAVQKRSNGGQVYVLQGNHDYSKRDTSALNCLPPLGVIVIDTPRLLELPDHFTVLCLPYIYPKSKVPVEVDYDFFPSIREVYSNPNALATFTGPFARRETTKDIFLFEHLFGHVGDETCGQFAQDCDLSWFPGEKTLGHIHKRVSKNVLGSTLITRRDEAGKKSYFKSWSRADGWQEHLLPTFLDFAKVPYGTEPKSSDGETVWINDLIDCPDPDAALAEYREKWPDVHFGEADKVPDKITLVDGMPSSVNGEETTPVLMEQFMLENQVTDKVKAIMRRTLKV